ncbi:MAG: 50S ribosomal protein L20 [Parachlamydiales bacterium]|jgi:large subunit ribosomal protein L20
MVRVTKGVASHRRKKRLFKQAKGFYGDRKNHIRLTKDAVMKAMAYNYVHRKDRKADFRKLWIIRLNVAAKIHGLSYSKFILGLKKAGCRLNRKILSELSIKDPAAFGALAETAKKALA